MVALDPNPILVFAKNTDATLHSKRKEIFIMPMDEHFLDNGGYIQFMVP
jgi:hypothetical protein